MNETFTLGHSPDPDDAFMFYAMATKKIDLRGYRFEHRLEDIQTLNERVMREELDISAISIHAFAYATSHYALLPCGASMGDGYGPIIVSKIAPERVEPREWLRERLIAVPGKLTSAFLALRLYLGNFRDLVVPFDKIFEVLETGKADAGLIIHEGQLTYRQFGFRKIVDLGQWWKKKTNLPLPLGGNVLRKDKPAKVKHDLLSIIRESIDFGLTHRREAVRHSLPYARDMGAALASRFIGMYVNDYTRDYGKKGREAIRRFLGEAREGGYLTRDVQIDFVE